MAIENFLDLTSRYQIWMTRPDAGKPISVFNAKKKECPALQFNHWFYNPGDNTDDAYLNEYLTMNRSFPKMRWR